MSSTSSTTCKKCTAVVTKRIPGLLCSGQCHSFYHAKCVDLSTSALPYLNLPGSAWKCPSCRDAFNSSVVADDDVLGGFSSDEDGVAGMLKKISAQLSVLNNKYDMLLSTVSICSEKVTNLEQHVASLDEKYSLVEQLHKENTSLKSSLSTLSTKVNDLEQRSRSHNLEICGVIQKDNENLYTILKNIGVAIGCSISISDIDTTHRVAHINKNSQSLAIL